MVLVPGHGGGAVFHEDQGDGVPVEYRVDDTGKPGMEKSGIAEKHHHTSRVVEKRQPRSHSRGRPHAHKQFTGVVRRLKPQGVAADIRDGDILLFECLLDGVKRTAVAASRTHLGRTLRDRVHYRK